MWRKPRHLKRLYASPGGRRKRRLSLPVLISVIVVLTVTLIGVGSFVVLPRFLHSYASAATTPNPNCMITIPPNPLSAQGLATPYQLSASDPAAGPCNEANAAQSAFVQAVILDPATGQISAYEPLVIDQGTKPAAAPVVPKLPANAVVGIWFGFNGTNLTQHVTRHRQGRLFMRGGQNANCVNGLRGSVFGQFSYCNAVNFFRAANRAIARGLLKVPALGMGNNGQPCPTTRSFEIVDMDQSDNVQTRYLVTAGGQTAQLNAANQAALAGATAIGNPSDNALLTRFVDPALGCTPWTVPDLVNPGTTTATLATDELMAAADQQAPVALVPGGDEMTTVNGQPNLAKTNRYRAGVDQPPAASLTGTAATDANTTAYCENLNKVQLPFLQKNMTMFANQASPDGGATANSLFTFLANRLNATLGPGGLNCTGLLNIQNPVTVTTDGNGVVTAAAIQNPPLPAGAPAATPTAP